MKTKNLFTITLVMILACVFAFGINTTVNATTTLDNELTGIEKTDDNTLKVTELTQINLEIRSGEKVTLDLNGKSLDNTSTEGMPTIIVDEGAELTIIDSSNGSGYIRRDIVVPGFVGSQPVIRNNGTLTITGGTILTSEQSCYGIENTGKLNINGGSITVSTKSTYGIFNNKEGEVNITDGRFQQGKISNDQLADYPFLASQGKLNITGGTFINTTGNKIPSIANITGGEANITGGKFVYQDPNNGYAQENQDMSTLIPDNFELDSNGNVVEKQEPTEQDPTEQQPTEQEPNEQQPNEPEVQEPEVQQPATGELDDEPNTGVLYTISLEIVGLLSLAGAIIIKKFAK